MLTPPKYLAPEVRDLPRRRGRAETHSSPTPLLLQRPAGALSEPTAPPASPARSSRRGSRGPCPASSPLSPGRAAQRASLSAPKTGPGPSGPAQPRGRLGPRPRRVGRWQGRTRLLSSGLRLRHCPQSGRGAAPRPAAGPALPRPRSPVPGGAARAGSQVPRDGGEGESGPRGLGSGPPALLEGRSRAARAAKSSQPPPRGHGQRVDRAGRAGPGRPASGGRDGSVCTEWEDSGRLRQGAREGT